MNPFDQLEQALREARHEHKRIIGKAIDSEQACALALKDRDRLQVIVDRLQSRLDRALAILEGDTRSDAKRAFAITDAVAILKGQTT